MTEVITTMFFGFILSVLTPIIALSCLRSAWGKERSESIGVIAAILIGCGVGLMLFPLGYYMLTA